MYKSNLFSDFVKLDTILLRTTATRLQISENSQFQVTMVPKKCESVDLQQFTIKKRLQKLAALRMVIVPKSKKLLELCTVS
jgi:hypothetical protein